MNQIKTVHKHHRQIDDAMENFDAHNVILDKIKWSFLNCGSVTAHTVKFLS